MELKYENQTLKLIWKNKITTHNLTTKLENKKQIIATQHIITLNPTLIKLTNIKKALFLYPYKNNTIITTQEPQHNTPYDIIKTRNNGRQKTIQLPTTLPLKRDTPQTTTITYHTNTPNPHQPENPLITLQIHDTTPTHNPNIPITIKNNNIQITTQHPTHPTLKQLLTPQQQNKIQNNPQKKYTITINHKTQKTTLEENTCQTNE